MNKTKFSPNENLLRKKIFNQVFLKVKKENGFSIFELVMVVAIIAILAGILTLSAELIRSKTRDSRRISDLKQIQLALEKFNETQGYYPCFNADCTPSCSDGWISNDPDTRNCWIALQTALSPYLDTLPLDPQEPRASGENYLGYWYHAGAKDQSGAELCLETNKYHCYQLIMYPENQNITNDDDNNCYGDGSGKYCITSSN